MLAKYGGGALQVVDIGADMVAVADDSTSKECDGVVDVRSDRMIGR